MIIIKLKYREIDRCV